MYSVATSLKALALWQQLSATLELPNGVGRLRAIGCYSYNVSTLTTDQTTSRSLTNNDGRDNTRSRRDFRFRRAVRPS